MGGENYERKTGQPITSGSSPRGRGKLRPGVWPRPVHGLIPAWAGKTEGWEAGGGAIRAHPRVGGENDVVLPSSVRLWGSSPRGRGKPAHSAQRPHAPVAHPRVGGENRNTRILGNKLGGSSPRGRGKLPTRAPHTSEPDGSSPRGRGKLLRLTTTTRFLGLIPAWAGKTWLAPGRERRQRAHPRVGGENPDRKH